MNIFQKPENLCAAAMIGFFFLPWGQLFGMTASGYNLSQFGSYGNWAWVIPILAGITLFAAFSGSTNAALPLITGTSPFVGLAYGLVKVGGDIFHILAIGAYLTIIAGAGIVLFALIAPAAIPSLSKEKERHTDSSSPNPSDTRKCPSCAELVKIEAKICKHCRADLPDYKAELNEKVAFDKQREEQLAIEKANKKREVQLLERYSMGHRLTSDEANFLKERGVAI